MLFRLTVHTRDIEVVISVCITCVRRRCNDSRSTIKLYFESDLRPSARISHKESQPYQLLGNATIYQT